MNFQLISNFKASGDQPEAIKQLYNNLKSGVKRQTLLGVTGSGKSVTPETIVLIKDENSITKQHIGSYIDNLFDNFKDKIKKADDNEVLSTKSLADVPDIKTYSFNPYTKKSSWESITHFTRHRSPKYLYKITTKCGREIITTGDHNFLTLHNDKLTLTKTEKLGVNYFLPLPLSIEKHVKNILYINLSKYFDKDKTYVYILKHRVVLSFKNALSKILPTDKIYRIAHKGERISFRLYQCVVNTVPKIANYDIAVGSIKKRYQFSINQKIDDGFLRFLGYYIAEGHAEKRFVIISSGDQEIISDFKKTIRSLNLKCKKCSARKYDYQISSSLWSSILSNLCGDNSKNKHLPNFWPQLSDNQLSSLLKAYFSADGGVEKEIISCTTASKELASDIMYALLRFAIVGRMRKRNIKIPNKNIRGEYWTISISGKKFIQIFRKKISFSLNRKIKSLDNIISKKYNTNVDIIPVNKWFKNIREKMHIFQYEIAEPLKFNRSHLSMIENYERMPSRVIFKKIIYFLKNVAEKEKRFDIINSIKEKESLLNLYWTPIKSIEKIQGKGYVYDFSVQNNETFLAGIGGIFVHNTFTMANIIEKTQMPALVISPNKTLAAQLYQEFKSFFPKNAAHYFVSYYDYYQPEAYIPQTDTYIEKDAKINEQIDRLRHSAVQDLMTRKDIIITASVSCIYNIGSPENYQKVSLEIKKGQKIKRNDFISKLTSLQYQRNDTDLKPGTFRVRGDVVEIYLVTGKEIIRIEFKGDIIEKIGDNKERLKLFPAHFWMAPEEKMNVAIENIKIELKEQLKKLKKQNKLLEAERLEQRTNYDLEMLKESGFCSGIENYSRHLEFRKPGQAPFSLVDYFNHFFPKGFLIFIDESHISLPQIKAMAVQDKIRKQTLIEHGFRLPSAIDNRPLTFQEFEQREKQTIYVSATPSAYEKEKSGKNIIEQLVRPTGLLEPSIEIRTTKNQMQNLIEEIEKTIAKKQRTLVVTITKKLAELISDHLTEKGIKNQWLHSEVKTLERPEILKNLRQGKYDVLVGINLLREGLDLPEVSLIAILDADKEGFLRNQTTLIQTMGRAARHPEGHIILYADKTTGSMKLAIKEIERRRKIQEEYNKKHNITPRAVEKNIKEWNLFKKEINTKELGIEFWAIKDKSFLEKEMKKAAQNLDFERAAEIRDMIKKLPSD